MGRVKNMVIEMMNFYHMTCEEVMEGDITIEEYLSDKEEVMKRGITIEEYLNEKKKAISGKG